MRQLWRLTRLTGVVLVAMTVLIAYPPGASAAPKWKLKAQTFTVKGEEQIWVVSEEIFKLIERKTGGQVAVSHHPFDELIRIPEYVPAVGEGTVDIFVGFDGILSGRIPGIEWGMTPLAPGWPGEVFKLFDFGALDIVDREFQKRNLKLIAAWNWGEILVVITKNKHIQTLDDWKGRRLRIPPGAWVEAVKALGAAPVAIGPGEVYLAIERGVVDGALTGIDTGLVGWRLHEVAPFISFTKDFPNGGNIFIAMNLKRFQEMPKEIQDAILAAGREGSRGAGIDYVKKRRDLLFERVPKLGGKLIVIPDAEVARWRKIADPAVMKWYFEKGGPLAKEFADLIDRFKRERR